MNNAVTAVTVEEGKASEFSEAATPEEPAVIEGDVADGEAEPVQLSASFEQNTGTKYQYNIKDKVRSDKAPPSAIKIERLPKYGKMIITEHDGSTRELQVGDIVSTKLMKNFKYEQGEKVCSPENQAVCDDQFLYTTLSSWIGLGAEFEQQIKLNPVKVERAARGPIAGEMVNTQERQIDVAPLVVETEGQEEDKAAVTQGGAGCTAYPHVLVGFMGGLLAVMVSVFFAMVVYIMHLQRQKGTKKTEASKDFDSIAHVGQAQQEAELK